MTKEDHKLLKPFYFIKISSKYMFWLSLQSVLLFCLKYFLQKKSHFHSAIANKELSFPKFPNSGGIQIFVIKKEGLVK